MIKRLRLSSFIDGLNLSFAKLSAWLCFFLVLLTTEQVVARYLFNQGSIAMQELEWHLFACVFLLSAGYCFQTNEHVRVDILYNRFSPEKKRLVEILGFLFFLLPSMSVIIYYGFEFSLQSLSFESTRKLDHYTSKVFAPGGFFYDVLSSIEAVLRRTVLAGEASPDPGGLEGRWLIKFVIPLGASLLLLQATAKFLRDLRQLWSAK